VGHLKIDINCDMGEGCASDAELMKYISSTNIACGFHAGDADTMKRTVDLAIENNVAIGAHPGYRNRENFGRTNMQLPPQEVYEIVTEQIATLNKVAKSCGAQLAHVKPHGALYNQAAKDNKLAVAIADAVYDFDNKLILFGLSGSKYIDVAEKRGLHVASEVFADRTYQNDGSLTSRTQSNALINNPTNAATQVLDMVKYGRVRTVDAVMIKVAADTVCIHGDGANAVEIAKTIHRSLIDEGIEIAARFKI
jgi:5-oxoprolinase (ATP-hydrolysing) subunit A